jgi:hypothetical protein
VEGGGGGVVSAKFPEIFQISVAIHVNIRAKVLFVVGIDISIAFRKQKKYFGSNSGIYF